MAFQAGVSVALQRAEDLDLWSQGPVLEARSLPGSGRMGPNGVSSTSGGPFSKLEIGTSCLQTSQWGMGGSVASDTSLAPLGACASHCALCSQALLLVFSLPWGWCTESLAAGTGAFQGHQCFLGQPNLLVLRGLWAHGGGFVPHGPEGYLPGSLSSLGARLGGQTTDFSNWALNRPQTRAGVLPSC